MKMVKDPVCGVELDAHKAPFEYMCADGTKYFFHAAECLELFRFCPENYTHPEFTGEADLDAEELAALCPEAAAAEPTAA